MRLIPTPKNCDRSVRRAIQILASQKLGTESIPTFLGVTVSSATISALTTNTATIYQATVSALTVNTATIDTISLTSNILMSDGGSIATPVGPGMTFDDTNDYLEIMGCKVGIGTVTPSTALHVVGTIYVISALFVEEFIGTGTFPLAPLHAKVNSASTISAVEMLRLERVTTDAAVAKDGIGIDFYIERDDGDSTLTGRIENVWSNFGVDSDYADLVFYNFNDASGLEEGMRLHQSRLGVGTSTPAYKLDVVGGGRIGSQLLIPQTSDVSAFQINGFDDKSGNYLKAFIDANGIARLQFSNYLLIDRLSVSKLYFTSTYITSYVDLRIVSDGYGFVCGSGYDARIYYDGTDLILDSDEVGTGSTKIGDASNHTEIKPDGEINLAGTARVKKSLWLGANAVKDPPTKPAVFVDHGIAGSWQFTDGTDDTIVAHIPVPQDMDISVAPSIKIGWSSTATEKNAVWQAEYLWRSANEESTAAAQETLSGTFASSATAEGFIISEITGVDVPSSSDICLFLRIKRLGADANDTLSADAELHGICLSYTSNKLGEAT